VKDFIRSALSKVGVRVIRTKNLKYLFSDDALDDFFGSLKGLGFIPKHIVDVGANHGDWTRTAIKYFPDAHYILVEPQDHLKIYVQNLLDKGHEIDWINAGAGERSGTMVLNIAAHDDQSSFVVGKRYGQCSSEIQLSVAVKTLNEITSGCAAPPDMVKIDAEGFDLKVLAGASNLFGKTDIFLVEAMICGSYENTLAEVMKFMYDVGYHLIDMTTPKRHMRFPFLWLGEFAFLRNGSSLLDGINDNE
jgi:FkbM family methyltransferase